MVPIAQPLHPLGPVNEKELFSSVVAITYIQKEPMNCYIPH